MLKKIVIKNFKGIRELEADLKKITVVVADNGGGKTTLKEALDWLHNGAETDQSVKPIDGDKVRHRLETVVEIYYDDFALRRVYYEKWNRKRGESEKNLTGHTTDYFLSQNGQEFVALTNTEFRTYINSVFDGKYKILSDPFDFGMNLSWKDRRQIVFDVVGGEVTAQQVCEKLPEFEFLPEIIKKDTIENTLKRLVKLKNNIESALKEKDTEIKQESKNFPEVSGTEEEIQKEIDAKKKEILKINEQIEEIKEGRDIEIKLEKLEKELSDKISESRAKHRSLELEIKSGNIKNEENHLKPKKDLLKKLEDIETKNRPVLKEIKDLNEEKAGLKTKYSKEKEKTFDSIDPVCPILKINCEKLSENAEKAEEEFNINKSEILAGIVRKAKEINEKIEQLESKIQDVGEIERQIKEFPEFQKKEIPDYVKPDTKSIEKKIEAAKTQFEKAKETENERREPFLNKRKVIETEIDDLLTQKARFETIRTKENELKKLELEQKRLSDQSADVELEKLAIEAFIKKKVELSESNVLEKFGIKFRMYREKLSEGLVQMCEPLISCEGNLVPFSEANDTAQIFTGMRLVEILQKHYKIYPAMIVDDSTKIVKDWPGSDLQIIKLKAVKNKKIEVIYE